MDLEIFIWALAGGLFLAILGTAAVYYKEKDFPSTKQLSRDFILGAAVTGILYPILPETADAITSLGPTTLEMPTATVSLGIDPGVQVGPANF